MRASKFTGRRPQRRPHHPIGTSTPSPHRCTRITPTHSEPSPKVTVRLPVVDLSGRTCERHICHSPPRHGRASPRTTGITDTNADHERTNRPAPSASPPLRNHREVAGGPSFAHAPSTCSHEDRSTTRTSHGDPYTLNGQQFATPSIEALDQQQPR